jgi:hypothetical protein
MSRCLRAASAWLVAASLLSCGAAAAADDMAAAKEAFSAGRSQFESGEYAEAAASFRRAYELSPSWKLLYNVGQCEALAKRPGLALQAFEAYLSQGGDDVPPDRREEVLSEVERLRKMVGAVHVTAPDGARVIVDGVERERAPLPGPMMVSAGVTHELRIELRGETLLERPVRVSGGQKVKLFAEKAPGERGDEAEDEKAPPVEPSSETDQAPAGEESGATLFTWGWVGTGVGAALLVGGSITGGAALSIDERLEKDCPGGECIDASSQRDNDRMSGLATATNVLIGVGSAALATGVVLLVVDAAGGEGEDETVEVRAAPAAGPGFAALSVGGRF